MRLFLLILAGLLAGPCRAQEPDCVCLEELMAANGLRSPTAMVFPNDGSDRIFISEQIGIVWIMTDGGSTLLPEPFMDLTNAVTAGGERGFLALAFHPQFPTNRQIYIYYSVTVDGIEYTRLSEFLVSATNPDVVDYDTERILLDIEQPFTNHNGGDLVFDLDGFLLLGIGDGGAAGDPMDNGQDLTGLLGSVIRIDVNGRDVNGAYSIPANNPTWTTPGARPEIQSYGWRNPWRMGMDMGDPNTQEGRGRIFVADVGQNAFEEVDLLESGGNYAWRCKEGFEFYNTDNCDPNIPAEVLPILAYDHATVGECVTGGYVYRGSQNPNLNGWYIFADYMTKRLFRMVEPTPGDYQWNEIFTCSSSCTGQYTDQFGAFIQTFSQGPDGEVYFASNDDYSVNLPVGQAFRVVQDPSTLPQH